MKRKRHKKKSQEFSKQILGTAKVECWLVTIAALLMAWMGKDTSIFCYLVPAAWGGYAVARAFYYNKAKAENAIKLKKQYTSAGLEPGAADQQFEESMNEEVQSNY